MYKVSYVHIQVFWWNHLIFVIKLFKKDLGSMIIITLFYCCDYFCRDSKKHKESKGDTSSSSSTNGAKADGFWLRTQLRVRFIDREYKKGKYYNVKVSTLFVLQHSQLERVSVVFEVASTVSIFLECMHTEKMPLR